MAISQKLTIKQGQQLAMTPQLQQAIKLLQMSHTELNDFVAEELENNPILERGERGEREEKESASDNKLDNKDISDTADNITKIDAIDDNSDMPSMGSWEAASSSGGGRQDFTKSDLGIEDHAVAMISLREHLTSQVNMDIINPDDRLIGLVLIENLDESGYMTGDINAISEQLNSEPDEIERVLTEHMQKLEPIGVFARNLEECLKAQLIEKNRYDPAMQNLVENLELLAARKHEKLQKICGIDAEDLAEMISEIQECNPKPAAEYSHIPAQTLIPDILVKPRTGGGWLIELNPDTLPRVLINKSYHSIIEKGNMSKKDTEYLTEKMSTASWLVRALDQRANTILKTATEILKQQDAFFAHGVRFLKPLVLRDVASAIEMHESTISRVTANKYMMTPRGVFELKYFFSPAIPRLDGGDSVSSETVRAQIHNLIDEEQHDKILSDDAIVALLRDDGIDIARRTVSKYRESLKIPSSIQRRRDKSAI